MAFRAIALSTFIIFGAGLKANAETRAYDLTGFDEVEASAGVTVTVTVGPDFAVAAEAVRGDLDNLVLEVKAGRLEVSRDTGFSLLGFGRNDRFVVDVSLPEITEVEVTSGAAMTIHEATPAMTRAQSTSGATLNILGEVLGDIDLEATSGSTLWAEGGCGALTVEASSGATLDASGLICKTGEIMASSGSSLAAHIANTAAVEASSGASVALVGGAQIVSEELSSGASFSAN